MAEGWKNKTTKKKYKESGRTGGKKKHQAEEEDKESGRTGGKKNIIKQDKLDRNRRHWRIVERSFDLQGQFTQGSFRERCLTLDPEQRAGLG